MSDSNKSRFGHSEYAAHERVAPCKGCNDRTEDCHGLCERYIEWKAENDEYRIGYLKTKFAANEVTEFEIRKLKKRAY